MTQTIGERVGAIISASEGTFLFAGYGSYQGDNVPPKEVNPLLAEFNVKTPEILLDSGQTIYGCECWWGPEVKVKDALSKATKVVLVDINQLREQEAAHSIVKEEDKPDANS